MDSAQYADAIFGEAGFPKDDNGRFGEGEAG